MNNDFDNNNSNYYSKRNRQNKIWAWFFGGVSALLATTSMYYSMRYDDARVAQMTSDDYYRQQSLNTCRRSLYNLADGLENADANLGKLAVATTPSYVGKILAETEGIAEGAVADVSYLPMDAQIASNCAKYFNQLGDYCKSLSQSVIDKGALTEEQKNSLNNLRTVGQKLKKSVDKACMSDKAFVWSTTSNDGNYNFELELEDVNEETFDYPQLVYDGPFSDSVTENTIERQMLSVKEVRQKLLQTFKDYGVGEVNFVSKANGKATVYYFDVVLNGQKYSVATATDGMVAELNRNEEGAQEGKTEEIQSSFNSTDDKQSKESMQKICCDTAEKFAKALGYDVFAMWTSQPIDNRIYVNMIARQDDVNLYPDMVKMALDAQSMQVVGLDAFGYLANHKQRTLPQEFMTPEKVQSSLSQEVKIDDLTLCIVPDKNTEILCYEVKANMDGEEFLIYLDATDGKEVEILKIIDDQMGYTVM